MSHVTAVCPTTAARRAFLPHAARYFLRQTYRDSDLLVVGDGENPVIDCLPSDPRIGYVHLGTEKLPLGEKYNACVARARGPLVALWADDDWNAPWRLEAAQRALAAADGALIAGAREMLFHRIGRGSTWRYARPGDPATPYFLGGSVLFHKNYWRHVRQFDSGARRCADASFTNGMTRSQYRDLAVVLDSPTALSSYVAMIHPGNTGRADADPSGDGWSAWEGDLRKIMGPDAKLYGPGGDICGQIR